MSRLLINVVCGFCLGVVIAKAGGVYTLLGFCCLAIMTINTGPSK